MRSIVDRISESFYKNTGANITGFWSHVKQIPDSNQFWGEKWSREYTSKVRNGKLCLMINPEDDYKRKHLVEIDLASSEVFVRLMKVYKPSDISFRFSPAHGMVNFYLFTKDRQFSAHIQFHESMHIYLFNMTHPERIDYTEKYFHSHGWCSGSDTGIQDKEFIKEFVNSKVIF